MDCTPGQLVVLKSGGPTMTVAKVDGDDVHCFWMEKNGSSNVKRDERFPAVTLVPYVPPAPRQGRSVYSYRG